MPYNYKTSIIEPVIIPYNLKNVLINDNDLKKIFNNFGLTVETNDI